MKTLTPLSGAARAARTASRLSHLPSIRLTRRYACPYSTRPLSTMPNSRIRTQTEHSLPVRHFSTKHDLPSTVAPSFAFAFDIDGVLLHVSDPIPGATETLLFLQEHNIPFILLTNGGGRLESERVADLSKKLGVPLTISNFVQSHTPFQELVDGLRDKTILVTGANADKCRAIAEAYGFGSVVTPADIMAAEPRVWPFEPLTAEVYAGTSRPLPASLHSGPDAVIDPTGGDAASLKIDAIFVFNDPRDWALDIQIIVDLLLSQSGHLGTYSPLNGDPALPNRGWQADAQPPLYFSNADLFWSTGYHLPRFGQGAFQAAVAGVWRRVTGGHELERHVFGKPATATYAFAERVLERHRHEVLGGEGGRGVGPLRRVYMVGDNPESDIAGANDYRSEVGTEWDSILVKTGVWSKDRAGGEGALRGRFKPGVVVGDVRDGVRWALEREGWTGKL